MSDDGSQSGRRFAATTGPTGVAGRLTTNSDDDTEGSGTADETDADTEWPTERVSSANDVHLRALAEVVGSFSYDDLAGADGQLAVSVHRGAVAEGDATEAYVAACEAHDRLDTLATETATYERSAYGEMREPDPWASLTMHEKADVLADRIADLRAEGYASPTVNGDDGREWDDDPRHGGDPYGDDPSVGGMFADGGHEGGESVGALAALGENRDDGDEGPANLAALVDRLDTDPPTVNMTPQQVRETALYMLPDPLADVERARRGGNLSGVVAAEAERYIREACATTDDDGDTSGTANYRGRGLAQSRVASDDTDSHTIGALAALADREGDDTEESDSR